MMNAEKSPFWKTVVILSCAVFLASPAAFGGNAEPRDVPACDRAIPDPCDTVEACEQAHNKPCAKACATACDGAGDGDCHKARDTAPCNPCDPCSPRDGNGWFSVEKNEELGYNLLFGKRRKSATIHVGGWVESGIFANAHGTGDNGAMHTESNRRTDYQMNQVYLFAEKLTDTSKKRIDWGFRMDMMYGTDGPGAQSYGDESFDFGWGDNEHGYGLSLYQLYGTVSTENISLRYGKFITPLGWETVAAYSNFFYSHSYCYWIEPSTHVGALADFTLSSKLTLSAGWTGGHENGFQNRYGDSAVLAGLTYKPTDKATVYYWMNRGETRNGERFGDDWRFGDVSLARQDYFIQSLCFEWKPTDRFTYVLQYNLNNASDIDASSRESTARYSAYGINNHFLYKLNNRWSVGLRAEWLRDNGGFIEEDRVSGDYYEITLGLNWNPCRHLSVRPEIRFDWVEGDASPFDEKTQKDQVSGGFGFLYVF
ncbi:MAG TPA: hypothetical protein DEB39_13135 [Planctomycetaceae bacterium]|nr:hypothetical protein [Planctomycetaceae bacterium]